MNKRTNTVRKNLLPVLISVVVLLAGGSVSYAATYATYDFSTYTPGNLVGQSSPAWAAVTAANYTGTSPIQVASGVAQVRFGGATATLWQSAGVGVSDVPVNAAGKVTYFAYEMKVINAYRSSSGNGDYVTGLSTAATFAGGTHDRIFLKKTADSTKFSFGMNCATGIQYNDDLLYSLNSSYTIVIKHEAINGTGTEGKNDKVSFYVKSATEGAERLVLIMTQSYDGTGTYRKADGTYASLPLLTAVNEPTIFKSHGIFQRPAGSSGASNSADIFKISFGESLAEVGINSTPVPSVPVASPAINVGTGGFTANWAAASGATGYYLDVGNDIDFNSLVSGNLDVGNVTSYSVTGSFAGGTTLYYRVRAYNSAGSSANSSTQTVGITAVLVPTVSNAEASGTVTWANGPGWSPNNPVSASNATVTFNGVLNGVLTANNDTASPFVLNSLVFANSGAGTNDITGSVLQLTNNGATNPTITFANNSTYQRVSAPIQLDTNMTVSQSGSSASNSILAGVVSGVGGLTKSGGGFVYLTQTNNSFGGPVAIGNGTLVPENIGLAGQNSSLGTNGAITLGGGSLTGTLRWGSGSVTSEGTDKTIALLGSTGGGTIDVRGTNSLLTLNGAIDTGANAALRTFTLTGEGGATVNGLISGNSSLRVNGSKSRTVILANPGNSFGGPVTIDGNIAGQSYRVQVASIGNAGLNSPLGTNATINIGSTASNSFNFLVWSNTVPETTDKTINLAGAAGGHALINNKGSALLKFTTGLTATGAGAKTLYADQDNTNGVTEFAGEIPNSSGGTTALNKNGAGTLILSAANTFTGGFSLKGGTLELRHAQSLSAENALTFSTGGTGLGRVKVAYPGTGSGLGNLLLLVDGTIDLGTDNTAQIRFGSATGWTADKILTVTNSTGGGKLYILETNNVALSQIKSAENPTYPASLALDGLLTFTSPAPANTAPVITSSQAFAVSENAPFATTVGTVVGTDADANPAFSSWTIVSGNTGRVFGINPANGQITVVGTVNFEGTASYALGVTVSDGMETSAVGTVVISVINVPEYSDFFGSSSPTADDNGDGISNLMAYALGATSPSSVVVPPGLDTADPTKLTITALIRINDPKVSVVGEYGLTLGNWETASPIAGVDSSNQAGAVAGVTKRQDFSVLRASDPRKFLHLKASQSQ
jgi:autotransporter-associated beta strand protein